MSIAFPTRMIRNVTLGAPVCLTRRPKKPHGPTPIAHTGTRRTRIIRYYAAATRCATAWKLWPSVASLEHRNGAEHLRRA
jgi:hypothetical protein